ncbi:DHA2 family efflux MFS transporter permease subunit [Streptomyces coffeae]|nr:DHA2 family efflux MFS transporter permease subunit [Streptomyces coffeae]
MTGQERRVLALACAGTFVVIMDATIVSVALPDIRSGLGFSAALLPWVVNAFTLAFAGFLLLGGRLSDVFGQRRVFVAGMGLFTVARLVCGFVGSPELLLAARAVQGFGGALLVPVTLSLLITTFTVPKRRTRALGLWSAVGAAGATAGPVIGGLLTQWAGWRWVFFISVPIGVVTVAAALSVLPPRERPAVRARLDLAGAGMSTAGLVGVVYAVMRSSAVGWTSPEVLGSLGGGLVLLAVFVVHQGRWARAPLVALSVLRLRTVSSGNVVMLLLGLGFFASPVLLSLYLQDVHGYAPLRAGLGYLPVGLAMFVGAQVAGPLTVRLGARRAAVLCCLVGALGCFAMTALIGADSSYAVSVVVPGAVFGFGTAAAFTPITVAATGGVPPEQGGLAAGLLNTVRQTSGAIGLAVLTTLSAAAARSWAEDHPHSGGSQAPHALAHGYTVAFAVSSAWIAAAALVAALTMPRPPSGSTPAPPAAPPSSRGAGATGQDTDAAAAAERA